MPIHMAAPFAAAAAWGALQDCESDLRDSPKRIKPSEDDEELNEEQGVEIQTSFSSVTVNGPQATLADAISSEEQGDSSYLRPPSVKYSTSTFNDNNTPGMDNTETSAQRASVRKIHSFPAVLGPTQKQQRQKSTMLRRGSSQISLGSMENTLSGFVDGDFASGKVRDIPVDGCFVMAFLPKAYSLFAVGARKTVDFYETTTYTIAYRFERDTQVSALQWLPLEDHTSQKHLGRNYLAVGDLGGTVSLLQVDEEVLEMYGPTVVHTFQVNDQIRAIDLKWIGNTLLLAVGDKGGNITFTSYTKQLEPLMTNHVVQQFKGNRVLSLSLNSEHRYLGVSTMNGDVCVYPLEEDSLRYSAEPLFQYQRRGAVRSVAFSPDGSLFAFGGYDKTVVLVDTKLWAVVRELKLEGTINVLEFDPGERYLAVGTRDKSFVVFDTSTFAPIKRFNSPGWVTSISWGARSLNKDWVAVRSERSCISLLDLTPISRTKFEFDDDVHGTSECALSWSQSGRYVARLQGTTVLISDSHNSFKDAAKFEVEETLRGVCFCPAPGKEDVLAVVGLDGHLTILRLRSGSYGLKFEVLKALFVEEHLWVVAWSPDGSIIATGGRGKVLYLYSAETFQLITSPLKIDGRIWGVDFSKMPAGSITPRASRNQTKSQCASHIAVASGADMAIMFDTSFQPWLQVHRPRTARALCYHPNQPLLAIGDGSGFLAILDYEQEETIKEFQVGSRVNTVDFSPKGDFLAVGTDECLFTLFETTAYKAVQEIPVQGFGMVASFSPNGQCLALATADAIFCIVRLGPLLGVDLVPLDLSGGVEQLPPWALNEVLYRSGDGPSFIQRHMRKGEQDNLQRVADILKQHPEAIYAFDREANEGCFDTALLLRKPNLLKLAVMALTDGNLKLDSDAILTSSIPDKARAALGEITENYPPELVVDIMQKFTFMKVPFSQPMLIKEEDCQERGSHSYMDPWQTDKPTSISATIFGLDKEEPTVTAGSVMRTPAVLPLPGLGSMQFLSSLLVKAPPTVFDNDAMALILRVLWKNHIQKYFIFDLILYIIFFCCWIVLVDAKASGPNSKGVEFELGIGISVFVLNAVFAAKEMVQSDWGRRPGYIKSKWNIIDLLSIGCVWYYVVAGCFLADLSELQTALDPLAVITSLLLTAKLIAYLRGISDTGWLVSVLVHNFQDVKGFLLILFVILIGFTTTFRILFYDADGGCELTIDENDFLQEECQQDPFGSYYDAFVSSFQMVILGSYEPSLLYESEYSVLAIIIFILAVTGVFIVALNALISVLADSYARVQENAAANRRKERAELIVEYMSILPASKRRSIEKRTTYFHALLEADADGDLLMKGEDWQGGLNSLRREMDEAIRETAEQNQRALDQAKAEIHAEISSLRRETINLLEDLAGDVRSIRRLQSHDGITLNGKNVAKAVSAVKSIGRRGTKVIFGGHKK